jgi:hypothetical protein
MSVFVSYSHDNEGRVIELVGRLRADRVQVVFDRDMLPAGPNEGWLDWSVAQVRAADKILIVCSERYCARYEGREDPGVGCGAVLEGRAIKQILYDASSVNPDYRVVVLSEADGAYVPLLLKAYHHFKVYNEGDYKGLLSWLGVSASAIPAAPRPPATSYEWKIADRIDILHAFEKAVTGQSQQRILLVSGPSNNGKTVLMGELLTYAQHHGVHSALIDLKGGEPLDSVFESLRGDLGSEILRQAHRSQGTARFSDLIADLRQVEKPLLLIFDTYEQASEDTQRWLESQFLHRLDRASKIVVVIGGQKVPDHSRHVWSKWAEPLALKPIDDPSHWMEWADRQLKFKLTLEVAKILTDATDGNPAQLSACVERLALKARV